MKVTYHAYRLKNSEDNTESKFNLKTILDAFIAETTKFKRGFPLYDDYLYLVQEEPNVAPNTYFFVITRNNDLIKAIDDNLSVQDIRKKIEADEQIGVGSFVHTAEIGGHNVVAFVAQLLSPKINQFWKHLNEYLYKKSFNHLEICGHPLGAKATLDEVMKEPFIGKTSIEIGVNHSRIGLFGAFLGDQNLLRSLQEIDGIEIIMKPRRGKNIKPALKSLSKIAGEGDDVHKLTTKVKGDVYDTLTDLYVVGKGALCDIIEPKMKTSRYVSYEIGTKMRDNHSLREKLAEYYSDVALDSAAADVWLKTLARSENDGQGGKD